MLSPGTLIPRWATSGGLSSRGDPLAGVGMLGAFGGRLEVEGIDPALLTAPFESGGVPLLPSALIRSRIDGVLNVSGYIDEYSGGVRVDLESEALKIGLAEPIFGLNLGRPSS